MTDFDKTEADFEADSGDPRFWRSIRGGGLMFEVGDRVYRQGISRFPRKGEIMELVTHIMGLPAAWVKFPEWKCPELVLLEDLEEAW